MGVYHQKERTQNAAISSEQNRGSHCLSGAKMRGLLRRHVEEERMTITTVSLVTLRGIPMSVVGSSGTAGIGWVGVCQSWIRSKSSDGARLEGMLVLSRRVAVVETSPVVRVKGRHCSNGLTIRLSETTQS